MQSRSRGRPQPYLDPQRDPCCCLFRLRPCSFRRKKQQSKRRSSNRTHAQTINLVASPSSFSLDCNAARSTTSLETTMLDAVEFKSEVGLVECSSTPLVSEKDGMSLTKQRRKQGHQNMSTDVHITDKHKTPAVLVPRGP